LEVDTLALGGHPEAAIGVRLGGDDLHVCDDPTSAPENVRRATDDEGFPAFRRWLLRKGVVEQPLCDAHWARRADRLVAGAARRGGRHDAPAPRSTHLELMPGEYAPADLLAEADGGLYLHEIARGQLDPLTGAFQLVFAHGRRITGGHIGDPVGPCRLQGHVADLLGAIVGIGREVHAAGAGWCAKDGLRVPVWATAPALRLEGLRVAEA
ncbi:MAG: metallopeptidase TldD-related protein, partial [Acidobacteriota bacterium]